MICQQAPDWCKQPAPLYRQCARGACKKNIAYCDAHGGDERATKEMIAHHAEHDARSPDCIDGPGHHDTCSVVVVREGVPEVCKCECKPCKRAWFAANQPIVRDGKVLHHA